MSGAALSAARADQTLFGSGGVVKVESEPMAWNAPMTTTASCTSDAHGSLCFPIHDMTGTKAIPCDNAKSAF